MWDLIVLVPDDCLSFNFAQVRDFFYLSLSSHPFLQEPAQYRLNYCLKRSQTKATR